MPNEIKAIPITEYINSDNYAEIGQGYHKIMTSDVPYTTREVILGKKGEKLSDNIDLEELLSSDVKNIRLEGSLISLNREDMKTYTVTLDFEKGLVYDSFKSFNEKGSFQEQCDTTYHEKIADHHGFAVLQKANILDTPSKEGYELFLVYNEFRKDNDVFKTREDFNNYFKKANLTIYDSNLDGVKKEMFKDIAIKRLHKTKFKPNLEKIMAKDDPHVLTTRNAIAQLYSQNEDFRNFAKSLTLTKSLGTVVLEHVRKAAGNKKKIEELNLFTKAVLTGAMQSPKYFFYNLPNRKVYNHPEFNDFKKLSAWIGRSEIIDETFNVTNAIIEKLKGK